MKKTKNENEENDLKTKATWVWSADLGPGIIGLSPVLATWHLDRMCQIVIRRKGFTIASDFSGTAHSFAGDNLPAAFIDCLPWNSKPDKAAQIGAYMSISRVRHIDDIYITQPYAPTLFSQGDLPGPELLLKFQRRELSMSELKEAWDERRRKKQAVQEQVARKHGIVLSRMFGTHRRRNQQTSDAISIH